MDTNGQLTNDTPVKYIAKVGAQNYLVDEENKRISYLDARFYVAGENLYVPSVTTILEAYPKGAAFFEWLKKNGADSDEIRDEAGRRGSIVHELTEQIDRGGTVTLMNEDGSPKYKLSEWSMLEKYMDFRTRFPAEIYAVELNMVSAELGYGGTLDRLMRIDGRLYLVDIKTGAAVWPHYWLQQAAYLHLLIDTGLIAQVLPSPYMGEEITPAILHLNSKHKTDGKGVAMQGRGWCFVTSDKPTSHHFSLFNKVRALWLEEHAQDIPRLTTYQLEHSLK